MTKPLTFSTCWSRPATRSSSPRTFLTRSSLRTASQLSVVKSIEIIGEAASRIDQEIRQQHSAIPWQDIVGMRNRLVHGYFDIDLRLV